MTAGYERLLELARRERELIDEARWDEVVALDRERRDLAESLPGPPPAEARPLLEAAERAVRENAALIAAGLAATREELGLISRGRSLVSGYAAAAPVPRATLDTQG